jgi:hypothetical protein
VRHRRLKRRNIKDKDGVTMRGEEGKVRQKMEGMVRVFVVGRKRDNKKLENTVEKVRDLNCRAGAGKDNRSALVVRFVDLG